MKVIALKRSPKSTCIEKEIDTEIIRFQLSDEEYYEIIIVGEKLHIRSMSTKKLIISPRASNVFDVELI